MTTEEKAQRYDEMSKDVKDFFDGKLMMYSDVKQTLNYLFPELKESEGEKIRKEIIDYINRLTVTPNNIDIYNSWIDWLEKQGDNNNQNWKPSEEQINALEHFVKSIGESGYASPYDDNTKLLKSLINDLYKLLENHNGQEEPQVYETGDGDMITYSETAGYNVEPKLKIERGKWYVCIKNLLDDYGNIAFYKGDVYLSEKDEYLIPSNSNVPWMIAYCVDTYFKEWTIDDAKDGDILYSLDSNQPFIYKERNGYEQATAYCGLNIYGKFFVWNTKDCIITTDKYIPATKEQRDTLLKAMADAGYTFDFEKKELKLLISNGGDFESNNSKQNPTWSEEDEEMIDKIIDYMKPMPIFFESTKGKSGKEYTKEFIKNAIKWLKSIKGRIQPQQKWTEEDENGFGETLWAINKARTIAKNENDMGNLWYAENWLTSLKERLI